MPRSIPTHRTLLTAALALPLICSTALAATQMTKPDFVSSCISGGLGDVQTEQACGCGYDYLTTQGSELVREALFIQLKDGADSQASFLQTSAADSGEELSQLLLRLAGESEAMMDHCDMADE